MQKLPEQSIHFYRLAMNIEKPGKIKGQWFSAKQRTVNNSILVRRILGKSYDFVAEQEEVKKFAALINWPDLSLEEGMFAYEVLDYGTMEIYICDAKGVYKYAQFDYRSGHLYKTFVRNKSVPFKSLKPLVEYESANREANKETLCKFGYENANGNRFKVYGTVINVNSKYTTYGLVWKVTFVTKEGIRFYVTLPKKVRDFFAKQKWNFEELKDMEISCSAVVKFSEDMKVGFLSYPSDFEVDEVQLALKCLETD